MFYARRLLLELIESGARELGGWLKRPEPIPLRLLPFGSDRIGGRFVRTNLPALSISYESLYGASGIVDFSAFMPEVH